MPYERFINTLAVVEKLKSNLQAAIIRVYN